MATKLNTKNTEKIVMSKWCHKTKKGREPLL